MDNKTALIVDDSRTAAGVLTHMLQRESFHVDVVDYGQPALAFLRDNTPGIIFMDRLMPGMDGFETVKEIKANPRTATIPIVMYTAQGSGVYVGQAHALGAVDVLPKPPKREQLVDVFKRIDARAAAAREAAPATEGEPAAQVTPTSTVAPAAESGAAPATGGTEASTAPERAAPGPSSAYLRQVSAEAESESQGRRAPWWLVAVAVAVAFFAGTQYARLAADKGTELELLGWTLNQTLVVPYGETLFAGDRVGLVRGLVEQLDARGFRGTLRLEGHTGQFCQRASASGWHLLERNAPLDTCEVRGFLSRRESQALSETQSQEFRTMLGTLGGTVEGISVQIAGIGDENPPNPYPSPDQARTAGEWNAVAARNNRITVQLIPD